jgi:hypothetical protein
MPLTIGQPLNHLAAPPDLSSLSRSHLASERVTAPEERTLDDRSLGFIKGRLVHDLEWTERIQSIQYVKS